jgi:hypothetical protein
VVAAVQSRFLSLAAEPLSAARERVAFAPTWMTSPSKTRGGFSRCRASGRLCKRRRVRSMFTPGLHACAYKTASGRLKWPNRDPIGERGGANLYNFLANCSQNRTDHTGLSDEEHFKWTDWPLEIRPPTPIHNGETWPSYDGGEDTQPIKFTTALSEIDCCWKVYIDSEWGAKGWYYPNAPQNRPHELHHYDLILTAYNHFITTVRGFDRRCMSGPAAACYRAVVPMIADAAYHESHYRNYDFDCHSGDVEACKEAEEEEAMAMAQWNAVHLHLNACSTLEQ